MTKSHRRKNGPRAGHPGVRAIEARLISCGLEDYLPTLHLLELLGRRSGWDMDLNFLELGLGEAWFYKPSTPVGPGLYGDETATGLYPRWREGVLEFLVEPPTLDGTRVAPDWTFPDRDALVRGLAAVESLRLRPLEVKEEGAEEPADLSRGRWEHPGQL